MKRRPKLIYSSLEDIEIASPERGSTSPSHERAFNSATEAEAEATRGLKTESSPEGFTSPAAGGKAESGDLGTVAQPSEAIRLESDSYDFGRVFMGNREDRMITIHNMGDTEFIVESLAGLPAKGFSLVEPPVFPQAIPPLHSLELTVRFVPESVGKQAASLSIVVKGTDSTPPEVRLTGTGIVIIDMSGGEHCSPVFNSLGMSFVYIPSGSFVMGSPEHEPGRDEAEIEHEVTLSRAFFLQTTPVTQGQWVGLMGNNPSAFIKHDDDCPVEQVSWFDCQEFIKAINALGEGTYRLPTEAEWEYACRAGSTAPFALGDISSLFCDHDPILGISAWYCGNSDRATHPVAQKSPNTWHIYDMHGNVCEWCQDWYGEYSSTSETDPVGPKSGQKRVIRGGSWFSSAKNCRSASRFSWAPQSGSHFIGFRLVREI